MIQKWCAGFDRVCHADTVKLCEVVFGLEEVQVDVTVPDTLIRVCGCVKAFTIAFYVFERFVISYILAHGDIFLQIAKTFPCRAKQKCAVKDSFVAFPLSVHGEVGVKIVA